MDKFIPLSVPNLKGREIEYVTSAIKEEWVSTAGSYITEFENKLKEYVKSKDAVACQSGTAGLHLALLICGIGKGDEVIVPTLTFIAAVNPVKYVGAEPVFMDCDDGLTMDPDKLEQFCENECYLADSILYNKRTKRPVRAIIVVHVFGNLADMESIMKVADRYNLKVIEDATEALGSFYTEGVYKNKYAGTIGLAGVFSFNGNKIITTGGGGMIVSDNCACAEKARYLSTQAKDDTLYFIHNEVGFNYRMTNLQAAIGLAQLEQLEQFITIKKNNYDTYKKNNICLLDFRENIRANYWFYSYMADNRDYLIQELYNRKIQVRPIWKLIHTLKPYEKNQAYNIEKAFFYYERIVNLPCSSNLTEEEVKKICDIMEALK